MAYASGMPLTSSPSYIYQNTPAPTGGFVQNKPAPIPGDGPTAPKDSVQLGGSPENGNANADALRKLAMSTPRAEAPKRQPLSAEEVNRRASDLIGGNTSWGNLDEEKLGRDLVQYRNTPELIDGVFNKLGDSDRDDVGTSFSSGLNDSQMREMASTPEGKATLQRVSNDMNTGNVFDDEAAQVRRIGEATSEKHARLLDQTMPADVQKVLDSNGLKQQKLDNGNGRVNFDEYSVTVDKMPPGVSPEQFFGRFAQDPNGTVKNGDFDSMGVFQRRNPGQPVAPGTLYDIDMMGPDNGTVVVRDLKDNRMTVSTVDNGKYGEHPIYGNREFGYNQNEDGSTTFYTRAADRYDGLNGQTPAGQVGASNLQSFMWNSWTRGLAEEIQREGGQVRPNSRTEFHGIQ